MNPVAFYKQAGAKVTSPYGMRKHPITGKMTMHWGIDLDFPGSSRGRLWTSPYPGVVTHLGVHGARGKVAVVRIEGTSILQLTQHLDEFRCRVGDEIEQGWPIGTNGTTGNCTGPHLHYELRWDNGTPLGSPVWGDPAIFTPSRARKEFGMQKEYVVKKGDTLTKIASTHGIHPWQQLVDWNKDLHPSMVKAPNLIEVGWRLRLYDPAKGTEPAPGVSQEDFNSLALRVKSLEDVLSKIKKALYQG